MTLVKHIQRQPSNKDTAKGGHASGGFMRLICLEINVYKFVFTLYITKLLTFTIY